MQKEDITMGAPVVAADRLTRHIDYKRQREGRFGRRNGDWKGWVYSAARWAGVDRPKPVSGIVVGIRTVHEWGWRSWQGEEGMLWEPEGPRRTMVLVAENLRHEPARVWLEDVHPAPEQQIRAEEKP